MKRLAYLTVFLGFTVFGTLVHLEKSESLLSEALLACGAGSSSSSGDSSSDSGESEGQRRGDVSVAL